MNGGGSHRYPCEEHVSPSIVHMLSTDLVLTWSTTRQDLASRSSEIISEENSVGYCEHNLQARLTTVR